MANVLEQMNAVSVRGYVETESRIRSAAARLTEEENGQSTAEYLAIIVLIVAVGTAIVGLGGDDIAETIKTTVASAFEKLQDIVDAG